LFHREGGQSWRLRKKLRDKNRDGRVENMGGKGKRVKWDGTLKSQIKVNEKQ